MVLSPAAKLSHPSVAVSCCPAGGPSLSAAQMEYFLPSGLEWPHYTSKSPRGRNLHATGKKSVLYYS